jgi:hypothetical protein
MFVAFMQVTGTPAEPVRFLVADTWDILKIRMCQFWEVEEEFNKAEVWESLRDGNTVLYGVGLYSVYNMDLMKQDIPIFGDSIRVIDEKTFM